MDTPARLLVVEGDHGSHYQSLPGEHYKAQQIFDLEWDRVFTRQWLLAGHLAQIREAGDFFTLDIAGESIIVSRGDDGSVHAFYNVCRHHGSLGHAPTIPDGQYIDYADYGLESVRIANCDGFLFIYLGQDEPAPWRSRSPRCATTSTGPPLTASSSFTRSSTTSRRTGSWSPRTTWSATTARSVTTCSAQPWNVSAIEMEMESGARYAIHDQNFVGGAGSGLPVRPGNKSLTRTGEYVSALLSNMTPEDAGKSSGFHIAPVFGATLIYPDHMVMQTNFPQTATHTKQRVQWFVDRDAVGGQDYEVGNVTDVLDLTVREDATIIERNAAGASSRHYKPGPLSKSHEPLNHVMLSMYLEWLGEHGVPRA